RALFRAAARLPATLPIRVDGPPFWPYTRLGFSPQAIFRPCGAPGNFMSWTVVAATFLSVTPRPPTRLAEPGRICSEVMPPASAAPKPGSCGHTECSAQTWAVTGAVASLPSLWALAPGLGYTPRCECTSIRPGVTHLPLPSTRTASAPAARPVPTSATLP